MYNIHKYVCTYVLCTWVCDVNSRFLHFYILFYFAFCLHTRCKFTTLRGCIYKQIEYCGRFARLFNNYCLTVASRTVVTSSRTASETTSGTINQQHKHLYNLCTFIVEEVKLLVGAVWKKRHKRKL